MSGISTEQWERRKWYLIRSLFEDKPMLSPIPETQEVRLEPPLSIAPNICRPYSPLPDLIIEKEPNRHDEPEEYYQDLERRIMKFYRKIFINTEKSSSISELEDYETYYLTLDSESCHETAIYMEKATPSELSRSNNECSSIIDHSSDQESCESKENEQPATSSEKTSMSPEKDQSQENRSNEVVNKTKSSDPSVEVSTTSLESHNHEIIVTQALVHHTGSKETLVKNVCRMLGSGMHAACSTIKDYSFVTSSATDVEDSDEHCENEQLRVEFDDSSISNIEQPEVPHLPVDKEFMLETRCVTDASSPPTEPEIMRKLMTSDDSVQSINVLGVERYFSGDFSTDKRLEMSSARGMEEAEESSSDLSIILGTSSTTKIVRNKQFNRQNREGKRQILSEMYPHQSRRPSLKRKKFENLATQTSFNTSDEENSWEKIRKHFFQGNPCIFKLCSCRDHHCY